MARSLVLALALTCAVPAAAVLADEGAEETAEELAEEHEEGEHHGGSVSFHSIVTDPHIWAAVLNFGLLILVLRKLGAQPLATFLRERRANMETSIAEAAAMKTKAEARYNEYTAKMATLEAELKKLHDDMRRAAEEEDRRIASEAEEAAARMKAETQSLIDQHAQALADQVRREVVEAAIAAAQEVIARSINTSDQEKLAEGFRQRIQAIAAQARPARPAGGNGASAKPIATTASTGGQS